MKKLLLSLLVFALQLCMLQAQVIQTQIREELRLYMEANKNKPLPVEIQKIIKDRMRQQEPEHELSETERSNMEADLVLFFRENEFWKKNPGYVKSMERNVGNGAALCANGGFEMGNTAFSHFGGTFTSNSNNCAALGNIAFNPTAPPGDLNVPERLQIVTAGADPIINGLPRTRNGNNALRINSRLNSGGGSCGGYGRQVDMGTVTFTVDANTTNLTFWYAVVMQDPGVDHSGSNGSKPFFTARIRNMAGTTLQSICFDPSQNNMVVVPGPGNFCNDTLLFQPWTCGVFNLAGLVGQQVQFDVIAADCGQGAHFGYAYIDDICVNCGTPGNNGSVTVTTNDPCVLDGFTVNGTFTLPTQPGSNLTGIVVNLIQNGTVIASVPGVVNGNNYTATFPANTPFVNGATYDVQAVATFNTPGGIVITTAEINPGINNDYTVNNANCCDCGSWTNTQLVSLNPTSFIGTYSCGSTVNNKTLQKDKTYRLRFRYNCNPSTACTPTYTFSSDLKGTISGTPNGTAFDVVFTPSQEDCGLRTIRVIPNCGGKDCEPCQISFNVNGCDTCVEPLRDSIYCDRAGNPVLEFCLKNLGNQPVSFFGVTFPQNVAYIDATDPQLVSQSYYNAPLGMHIFQTASPVMPGQEACYFRFRILGGIYKGQQLCLDIKSFTDVQPNGDFQNCCPDTIPLCFTIPDCRDECADIVESSIYCDLNGRPMLRYKIRNNSTHLLGSYESFRINGPPADYFQGYFNPDLNQGDISPFIYHPIPSSIAPGSLYCFTNTVHWYISSQGHPCDSICYTDTVCLVVPNCGKIPQDDTVRDGGGILKPFSLINPGAESLKEFRIYPNPAQQLLNIQALSPALPVRSISIRSLAGSQLMYKQSGGQIKEIIDIGKLPSGMYLVVINGTYHYRILKK